MTEPDLAELHRSAAEMLELPIEELGLDDNLIECGLQSIQMINVAAGLRRDGIEVVFADLALTPTVRGWFELLRERAAGRSAGPASVEADTAEDADETTFPLATMQHAYWVGRRSDQRLGGVAAHLYAEFDGPSPDGHELDPDHLRRSVESLVARHEMLRAVFDEDGRQHVPPRPGSEIYSVVDLRDRSESEVADELSRLRDERTHQLMPAQDGKVTDITLTLLPGGGHRLHVDIDMLAADALSYRIILADLARIHAARQDELPAIGYSYRRYLADKPRTTRGAVDRDRQWWDERLDELPEPPILPLVPEHERTDPHRTIRCEHWIDARARQRLTDRAHRAGLTPAVVLAAVFAHVIADWSRDSEFLLNVPLFDREPTHEDVNLLSGDFSSSIMLPVDGAHRNFLALAEDMQRRLHTYASHSAYPGLDVLRDLGRRRGGQILAPVVYTSGLDLGELFHRDVFTTFGEPVWIVSQGPQVVLDAQVVELRGGLLTNWDVREQAFPPGMIDAMFRRHRALIDRLVADDGADWDFALDEAVPAEQLAVRSRGAEPGTEPSPADHDRLIHGGFFHHARATPDAIAVIDENGDAHTYHELVQDALAVAAALTARRIGVEDVVAVRLPKGSDQIVAVLAILATGAAYLPIGADQPESRIERMYRVARPVLVVTEQTLAELRAEARPPGPDLPVLPPPDSLAYIMFTSGSTGDPKGVELTHASVTNTLRAMNDHFALTSDDRSIATSALEFDLSVQEVFGLFAVGGSVVAIEEDTRRDGELAAETIRRHGVTQLYCVPSVLEVIVTGGERVPGWADTVRTVILGGDRVRPELLRRMHAAAPAARLAGLGGATETSIHHTVCEVDIDTVDPTWQTVPFGKPFRGVLARVVNDRGQDCPDWVSGELWIGGAGLARGYRDDPERTAQRFVEHDGHRWYRTGDTVRYLPDGTIDFLGRADDQVKVRGFRVELGEVESALRADEAVVDAVAVLADGVLAAAVTVPEPPGDPDAAVAAIVERTAEHVPPYMVPSTVSIMDSFPKTNNGKVDRGAIGRDLRRAASATARVAPRTPLETALTALFGEVVGDDRVGATDDFFDIGGDSVLATRLSGLIAETLRSPSVTVASLFGHRSPRSLAAHLEAEAPDIEHISAVAEVFVEVLDMSDDEIESLSSETVSETEGRIE